MTASFSLSRAGGPLCKNSLKRLGKAELAHTLWASRPLLSIWNSWRVHQETAQHGYLQKSGATRGPIQSKAEEESVVSLESQSSEMSDFQGRTTSCKNLRNSYQVARNETCSTVSFKLQKQATLNEHGSGTQTTKRTQGLPGINSV